MRSSAVLIAAPLAVYGQALSTITGRVQTATIYGSGSASDSAVYTTTWTYSNPATNFLSETNSAGVVTGMPSNSVDTNMPVAVTSQPPVATIPAGLPEGVTQILYNGTAGFTSFTVSVGPSNTAVLGASPTDASVQTGATGAAQTGSGSSGSGSGSNSNSNSNSNSASASGSASPSQSGNAASSVQVAGAGMGLFALIAALL